METFHWRNSSRDSWLKLRFQKASVIDSPADGLRSIRLFEKPDTRAVRPGSLRVVKIWIVIVVEFDTIT